MLYRNTIADRTTYYTTRTRVQAGAHSLALLLALSTVAMVTLIIIALHIVLPGRPARATAAPAGAPQAVQVIIDHLDGTLPDRQVEIARNIFARESNVKGIRINGTTYYYALQNGESFDPLSLGSVKPSQIKVIFMSEGTAVPFIVYLVQPGARM